jgi:hypothetical protein
MAYRDFVGLIHTSTKRDYLARVTQRDKAEVAEIAKKFDVDYWDGSRETGYGGYRYDGRWRKVADAMVAAYGLGPGMRVLDIGSGKGFLLHDLCESMPGLEVAGIDISAYGVAHTIETVSSAPRQNCAIPTSISTSSSPSTRCTTSTTTTFTRRSKKSIVSAAARNTSVSRPIATSARR